MLDIGWPELFIIAVIAIIVIGPKDLPRAMAHMARWLRKARSMAREFQSGVDDMVREAELEDIRKQVESTSSLDIKREIENTIDPGGEIAESLDMPELERDIEDAAKPTVEDKSSGGTAAGEDTTEVAEAAPSSASPPTAATEPEPAKAKAPAKRKPRQAGTKATTKAKSATAAGGAKRTTAKKTAARAKTGGGRAKKPASGASAKAKAPARAASRTTRTRKTPDRKTPEKTSG